MVVRERDDFDLLLRPVGRVVRGLRQKRVGLERAHRDAGAERGQILDPAVVGELIEGGRSPVEAAFRPADPEDGPLLLCELDPVVVGVPDVADRHRLARRAVRVPALPSEDAVLRDRRRGRGTRGGEHEHRSRDEGRHWPGRAQPGQHPKRGRKDQGPVGDGVRRIERHRPARPGDHRQHRRQRPPRRHELREHEAEAEDREHDDAVHVRLLDAAERDLDVVEVEEAVVEPEVDGLEEAGAVVGRGIVQRDPGCDEPGRNDQGEPDPELRRQSGREPEQHHPEPVRSGDRPLLEPEPDERDQPGRGEGDGERPNHARS
jgi:hypothetical protein